LNRSFIKTRLYHQANTEHCRHLNVGDLQNSASMELNVSEFRSAQQTVMHNDTAKSVRALAIQRVADLIEQ
jgi:hypothetical protein